MKETQFKRQNARATTTTRKKTHNFILMKIYYHPKIWALSFDGSWMKWNWKTSKISAHTNKYENESHTSNTTAISKWFFNLSIFLSPVIIWLDLLCDRSFFSSEFHTTSIMSHQNNLKQTTWTTTEVWLGSKKNCVAFKLSDSETENHLILSGCERRKKSSF